MRQIPPSVNWPNVVSGKNVQAGLFAVATPLVVDM